MSIDLLQHQLRANLISSQIDIYNFANQTRKSLSPNDMYNFQFKLQDYSNASWVNSQYLEFRHSIRKSALEAIN
ncbi:HrpF protein [Cedecea sp.]|jgi:hypothetical protein|uniref:HrpF protein n=1 Tax=Cedecea sp. TaxID=1970739 RepID=UPI0012AE02FE|nr:HrpF protein [Enterobacteriaceae bacterium RIT693]